MSNTLENGKLSFAQALWHAMRHGLLIRFNDWPEGGTLNPTQIGGLPGALHESQTGQAAWSVSHHKPGAVDMAELLSYSEALERLIQFSGVIYPATNKGRSYTLADISTGASPCRRNMDGDWMWSPGVMAAGQHGGAEVNQADRDLMEQAIKEANMPPPEAGN